MTVKLANNATSSLAANITAAATSVALIPAEAGKFPELAGGDWFPMTIVDANGAMEIVKVTARVGAVLTVERGQEGTAAKAFAAGAICDLRLTANAIGDVQEDIAGLTTSKADLASPTFTGVPKAPTPAAADSSTAIATTKFVQDKFTTVGTNGKRNLTISAAAPTAASGADGDVWFQK